MANEPVRLSDLAEPYFWRLQAVRVTGWLAVRLMRAACAVKRWQDRLAEDA